MCLKVGMYLEVSRQQVVVRTQVALGLVFHGDKRALELRFYKTISSFSGQQVSTKQKEPFGNQGRKTSL